MLFKALNICHMCQGVIAGQQCVGRLGLIKKWNITLHYRALNMFQCAIGCQKCVGCLGLILKEVEHYITLHYRALEIKLDICQGAIAGQ